MAKRVIFVGGGAGGLTCAVRLRRLDEKCEIIILEKSANVSVANCAFPYFIEGVVKERKDLIVRTPAFLMNRFNFDLRVNSEVISINRETKTVTVKETKEGGEERIYDVEYEKVVLSCGSDPICPPIPGIQNTPHIHFLRSLDDSDKLKLEFDHVKERMEKENKKLRVAMIGAGYIGMELTEALVHQGFDVTVFEYNKHVMGLFDEEMASPLNRLLIAKGVDLRLQTTVSEFSSFENQVRMKLSNGNELIADFVVVAIGAKPNSQICEKAGLNVGMRGAVRVDHQMRTSDPDIYAIGDQIELPHLITGEYANIQLAGPSNRQAHTAADSIAGRQSTYSGCQGTAICKIFDTTAALTGVSEREIKRSSNQEIKDYVKIYAYTANQVAYYPGSATIYMKLIFHRVSGRILGSQMIGMNGVDKRIDVIAVAVRKAMTVYDLEDLELAYAPPYNGPVDPVNNLGHIGANILRGDVEVWHFDEAIDLEKQFILDVRTAEENSRGAIPNSKLIPLDSLRAHIGEIDSSKEIMVYCQSGLRGYVASRLLSSLGFKCKNLSGGYLVYNNWKQLNP